MQRRRNSFARFSESLYQNPRSNLGLPLDSQVRKAFDAAARCRSSTYGRTSGPLFGSQKWLHNQVFATRLKRAPRKFYGLALDGAGLTTTNFVKQSSTDIGRLIVPNPCTARYDGLQILERRIKEPEYTNVSHVAFSLEQLLALDLPAINALEGSIAVVWLDLMNKVTNLRVVRGAILVPFFKRKWLANRPGAYFAITLSLRGIRLTDYDSHVEFWKAQVLAIAAENGYGALQYIDGPSPVYRNGRSNRFSFLSRFPSH